MRSKPVTPAGVPQSRTMFARRGFHPIDMLRSLAASWRAAAPFQRQILNGLQDGRPIYGGTATDTVAKRVKKAKRRARNKAARRSRRVNRMRASR